MAFRELLRKNQQLSQQQCMDILKETTRGVLSVIGEDGCIYFHSGDIGHRLDALKNCNKVSFCTYDQGYREEGDWAWKVKSVIVFGTMEIITDMDQIIDCSTQLSYKFTDDLEYIQKEIRQHAHRTRLLKLMPEHICGKLVTEN